MRKYVRKKKRVSLIASTSPNLYVGLFLSTLETFLRQRERWARGLVQTLTYIKTFFNPKYGKTGLLVFPYFVFYEF
jgi:cellulose synthase/poly-beta-1,6-N-acetylglucosamine synthase-like glycosyltransferase